MKKHKKIFSAVCLMLALLIFSGCSLLNLPSITQPSSVKILDEDVKLKVGESIQLKYTVTEDIKDQLQWSATGNNVSVSDKGLVVGLVSGVCAVIVRAGETSDLVYITVTDTTTSTPDPTVQFIQDSITFTVGQSDYLSYAISDDKPHNVSWTTSNDVVSIAPDGLVTALKEGNCTVTIILGQSSDTITITVLAGEYNNSISFVEKTKTMNVGETFQLQYTITSGITEKIVWTVSNDVVTITQQGIATAQKKGNCTVTITAGKYSDTMEIVVMQSPRPDMELLEMQLYKDELLEGDRLQLNATFKDNAYSNVQFEFEIVEGGTIATVNGDILTAYSSGTIKVKAVYDNYYSAPAEITVVDPDTLTNPYRNTNKNTFYNNYTEAENWVDAGFRSDEALMSGDISDQDQEPTIADNQPTSDGMFVRNTSVLFSVNGNTYYVFDQYGKIVDEIYRDGAYVTLEDVAAYVFAFGDIPANYVSSKYTSPTSSDWAEYLRLNHSYFSGDTEKYPYEPVLPNISGCGGTMRYYEIDIGTTGTDCDPSYPSEIYNDGETITRGAARIVYAQTDNGATLTPNQRYLFYTYNHYNDFQEYLNYRGGWGEMFGNITGGGTISSKYDYNPTPYVPTAREDFSPFTAAITATGYVFFDGIYA